jgi:hypothetical protein
MAKYYRFDNSGNILLEKFFDLVSVCRQRSYKEFIFDAIWSQKNNQEYQSF